MAASSTYILYICDGLQGYQHRLSILVRLAAHTLWVS